MIPNPNCRCCGPTTCVITTTNDLADYTQVSGTWTKPATFILTTDAAALIIFNTPHPEGFSQGRVQAEIAISADAVVRLLLAYKDPNNYLFLEIELTNGVAVDWARMGHRTGGVDTFLEEVKGGPGVTTPQPSKTTLCFNGEMLSSGGGLTSFEDSILNTSVNGMDSPLSDNGDWGTYIGIEVLSNSGTVSFKNFVFNGVNDPGCAVCGVACVMCGQAGTPSEYSLFLDDVVNDDCGTCEAFYNGATFILTNPNSATSTRNCYFRKDTLSCAVVPGNDYVDFALSDITGDPFAARLRIVGDGEFNSFGRTAGVCDEVLTQVGGGTNPFGSTQCDWSGATAILTPNMA